MQVLRVAIQAAKAGTLRSVLLPQRTVAEVVVVVLAPLRRALAVAVAPSVLRVQPQVQQDNTAAVVVITVALILVSMP